MSDLKEVPIFVPERALYRSVGTLNIHFKFKIMQPTTVTNGRNGSPASTNQVASTSIKTLNSTGTQARKGALARYYDFCDRQDHQRAFWFIVPLMIMSAAIMPVTIFMMSYFGFFLPFIGISILSFFTNIILSIAGQPTRVTITFFLFTVAFHFAVPLLLFVIGLLTGS